jgi:hypothetical protein
MILRLLCIWLVFYSLLLLAILFDRTVYTCLIAAVTGLVARLGRCRYLILYVLQHKIVNEELEGSRKETVLS